MAAVTITRPPANVNHQPQARSEPGGGASPRAARSTAAPQHSVATFPGQDLRVNGLTAASERSAASVASHPSWDPSCPLRRTGPSDDHDTQDPISVITIATSARRGQVVTRSQLLDAGSRRRHQDLAAATGPCCTLVDTASEGNAGCRRRAAPTLTGSRLK